MGKKKADPVEQVFVAFFVVLIVAIILWNLLPHWVIYTVGGVLLAAVAIGIVLRIKGGSRNPGSVFALPFLNTPPKANTHVGSSLQTPLKDLSDEDRAVLQEAVGRKCENRQCRTRYHQNLEIHHIVPRTYPQSTNRLDNLLVLCPNCHANADRNQPGKNVLRFWARNRRRFAYYYLVRNWNSTH